MAMVVPVLVPEFWQRADVTDALCQALGFGTDDLWSFSFVEGRPREQQLHFDVEGIVEHSGKRPDSVVLFSGGMDSLCAMVEAISTGLSPIAVSHRASLSTASPQRTLTELLRQRHPDWSFPHLSFRVHQRGEEANERTRRSRGFLFTALGAAVAGQLDIPRVLLSDNGYVSLNPAINAQLVGALNSRGTHPTFLRLVNCLLELVFPGGVVVENSLADRTRSEALQILKDHGCADIVRETRSCANSRMPQEHPHCGVCSQCVDRRFATLHAGMEALDPAERYRVDIFRDALQEGREKTFAVSYVGFARRTMNITPDDLLLDFPEFDQCLDLNGPDPSASAARIHGVLARHANEVIDVLAREVARESQSLARGTLSKKSLLVLATGEIDQRASQQVDQLDAPPAAPNHLLEVSSLAGSPVKHGNAVTPGPETKIDEDMSRQQPNAGRVSEIERLPGGWWVRFDDEKALFRNTKGVRQLVTLLKAPKTDVPALDLYAEATSNKAGRPDPDVTGRVGGQGGNVVDRTALNDYAARAIALQETRRRAEANDDRELMAEIDNEMEWLAREAHTGRGKGGRLRQFTTESERARSAVSQTLKAALGQIEQSMPNLSRHLQESLHLGGVCRYEPWDARHWVTR